MRKKNFWLSFPLVFFLSSVFLLLTGCASQSPAPTVNVAEQLGKPIPGKAVLVIYRGKIKPHHFPVAIALDGQPFTELHNHTFSWTYLEPGDYVLTSQWPNGALIPRAERPLSLAADQYYLVEMRGGVGVAVVFKKKELNPTNTTLKVGSYEEALSWLNNCCEMVEHGDL